MTWSASEPAVRVLGSVSVEVDGLPVPIGGPLPRRLLAVLMANRGAVVSVDRLVEVLWGDAPPETATSSLHTYVSRLRHRLPASVRLETIPPGYRLGLDPGTADVERFEVALGEALACVADRPEAALAALVEALSLWRGDAFAEFAGEWWAQGEAARLEEQRVHAREAHAETLLALGRSEAAVSEARAVTADHPNRERAWRTLVLGLHRGGRQADALRAAGEYRAWLRDESGLDPSKDFAALERDVAVDAAHLRATSELSPFVATPARELASLSAAHRHNLPVALTRFVGRASELEDIGELLGGSRLLTLTGVGGTGKTRLALQAAADAVQRYPDGVWLVELATMSDERAVPSALKSVLGVVASGADSPEAAQEAVYDDLAGKHVLLVIDNCEHLVGAVARLVHGLLTRCPTVRVMATSRQSLGVAGEVTFAVPPLSLPPHDAAGTADLGGSDAVALFCERARAARPQFRLTPANAGAVARICRRLDGIPLALELAAARVRVLGVDQIEQRLGDCFRLLTGGAPTDLPHHQTLRATLDWSHDLLAPAEQVTLRRLAVFPGPFGLDAAVAVVTADEPAVTTPPTELDGFELISQLVDKSLLVVHENEEELRYRLLEPVREYAAERSAQAGETQAARRRHRDFFVALADRRIGFQNLRRVALDMENFRAALEWSWDERDIEAASRLVAGLAHSWFVTGDPQGREWLERVVADPQVTVHRARVSALTYLALVLHDSSRPDVAREEALMREAASLARRLDDAVLVANCDIALGELELSLGKTAEARSLFEAALGAYERLGSPSSAGLCHDHLGWVAVAEHDHESARAHFERAAEVARSYDKGEWLSVHALAALAPLTVLLGEPEQGLRQAEEAVVAARGSSDRGTLLMALTRSAEAAVLAGDHRRAGDILGKLLALVADLGTRRWLADALELTALVLEWRAEPGAAAELLGASEALREGAGQAGGGVRAVAEAVERGRDRLVVALGPDGFADHAARGRRLRAEAAIAQALAGLGAPPAPPPHDAPS